MASPIMNSMKKSDIAGRRGFLKRVALAAGGASQVKAAQVNETRPKPPAGSESAVQYPRTFTKRQLEKIAFPLGGVAAGSVALGGRGQLLDWEIFNRPDKGKPVNYAFPSICVQVGQASPVVRGLES